MVKAGESGGVLAEILDRLASYLEATNKLKKKVKSSMAYPVIVSIMATIIVIFLLVRVIPVFEGIYKDFNAELPAPTQLLIDVSHFITDFWYIVLIGGGTLIFGFLKYIKSPGGRAWWDGFKIRLPVFGPLLQKIAVSRFARTFAQLIRSGVPIIETLQIVAASSGNYQVEIATYEAQQAIEKGEGIAPALAKHRIFPPMIIRMISAGESTGKVDQMLEKISDYYDSEIDATLSAFTALIEPLMIAILGVIIGGIVVAMFMPIFKLHEIVTK
jgi:type IV pilus assembly protein PilC